MKRPDDNLMNTEKLQRASRSWAATIVLGATLVATASCTDAQRNRDTLQTQYSSDSGFQNPPGSPERTHGFLDMVGFFIEMIFDQSTPEIPAGHILPKDEVQMAALNAPNPSVTWLGHAAFIVRTGGKVILTDPFLGSNAGPAGFGPKRHVPPAMTVDELPPLDIILISHNHYDHLDVPTLEAIKDKDRIEVVVPLGLGELFREMGYRNIHELDWWQDQEFDRVRVQLQPAVHFSGRGIFDRNDTLWGSFGVYSDDARIWFSGDTGYGPVLKEIGVKAGPFDLALVAIGAFKPRKIMKAVHVSPEEAIQVLKDVGAKKGIGMHWGTIKMTLEKPFSAAGRFKAAALDQSYGQENALILAIGETYVLDERTALVK